MILTRRERPVRAEVPFDTDRRQARADRHCGAGRRRRGAGVLDLPARHRRLRAAVQPADAFAARRLPAGARLPTTRSAGMRTCAGSPPTTRCSWPVGFTLAFYHLVFGRAHPALGRSQHHRSRRRHGVHRAGVRGRAPVVGIALPIICAPPFAYGCSASTFRVPSPTAGATASTRSSTSSSSAPKASASRVLVSATYIFLFILFGSSTPGWWARRHRARLRRPCTRRPGPKVSVIPPDRRRQSPARGGRNVLTTGQFTPLMKRFGYSPVSRRVEATSSMGGQIMPPVMGAVAFIMAETLNVPLRHHREGCGDPPRCSTSRGWCTSRPAAPGSSACRRRSARSPLHAIRRKWYLRSRWSCWCSCCSTASRRCSPASSRLALTAVLTLGVAGFGSTPFRVVFWIVLGVGTASFFEYGSGRSWR